jgi:ATP-binding cassette subfamily B protein/ATP-binding cassette subfamily B multidrug efflux pump
MAAAVHPLLRCFAFYRRHAGLFIAATAVALVVNLSLPFTQHLIGLAIDELKAGVAVVRLDDGSLDLTRAWWWAAVLMGFAFLRGLVQYFGTLLGMVLGQRLLHDLRDRVLTQVQRLDQSYHRQHGTGEIITRTTRDSDKVRDAVVGGFRTLLETALVMLACLAMLAWYDPLLAAVPLLLVTVALLLFIAQARHLVVLDRATGDAYDVVTQELTEGVGGVRVIKAFALEERRSARFREAIAGFAGRARRALAFAAVRLPGPQVLVGLGHVWILGCGSGLVAAGQLSLGELVAALMVITAIIFRVEGVGRTIQTFAEASASAARIMELLDAEPAVHSGDRAPPAAPFGVRFCAVTVRSPAGVTVLDRLDLAIAPGEVVALVGATGSGKSTLAHLLPRLADPVAGSVVLGDDRQGWHDVRSLRLDALRRVVQVVYQDSFLFSDTVAANLRLGRPDASDDEISTALRLASAEDIVAGLPDGLATVIGERGATLSGGQRQRLCLGRALIARPAVLCCDDATSALDAVTERRILDNLRSLHGGTTVLLIASKLSTILLADRVVLLEHGRITASGRHADLVRDHAAYRELLGATP